MVSSLAHQIRTPLSAAMLYSANLSKTSLPEQSRLSFQDKLHSRLQDLEQRVNDMLLFSKSGKEQVVSPLSVNTLIKESVSAMEVIVSKANGAVDVEYCDSDCSILANKNALSGAIQNLIHNAIQAYAQHKSPTDPHGVKVAIQIYCQDEHAYISVKDNGAGISSELKNKIFQPFYTSSKQGTGLGLAVVKSVVNAHQGNVSLLSDSGEGAHFCLTLPLLDSVRGNESIQKEKQNEQS
jgi:two-component system sensor histidine kinase FlrB